jgi:ABC-type branched-subunit amino acid transport system ATPase component
VTTDDVLLASNVSKSFPGVKALSDVSIRLARGSIHALLGEKGAGKSTLIKIITGVYRPDSGTLTLDGAPLHFNVRATRSRPASASFIRSATSFRASPLARTSCWTVLAAVFCARSTMTTCTPRPRIGSISSPSISTAHHGVETQRR